MAAPLTQSVRDAMKARATKIKDNLAKGEAGAFTRTWNLHGKNAIVAVGGSVIVRVMPRWDRYVVKDGKVTADPAALDKPLSVEALEHWWDGPKGRTREWCPGTFGDACPVCEATEELRTSADPDDRARAKDLRANEVAVFNAIIGPLGQRRLGEGGKVDLRPITVPGTVELAVSNIMTGGDQESFARGDISDPREGYDLNFQRPGGKGDRWKVDCAPNATPLFSEAEKPAFAGWWSLIHDLDALLEKETKSYDELYKLFHGVDPEPGPGAEDTVGDHAAAINGVDPTGATAATLAQPAAKAGGLDLDGLGDDFPMEPAKPATPAAQPARQAAPAAQPATRARRR